MILINKLKPLFRRGLLSASLAMKMIFLHCLFLTGLTIFETKAQSIEYEWKNVQILAGGYITGIIFNPSEKDLVYVRTDVGGAYRWDAANKVWIPITDGFGEGDFNLTGILSIATDPTDTKRVYLAAGLYTASWWGNNAEILSSADKGQTWTRKPMPFKLGGNDNGRSSGERLQVDPNKNSILFCGTNNDGLWQSTDYAATWTRVTGFTVPGVTFVAFDKNTGTTGNATQTIYVGANNISTSLYKSTDGGVTWSTVANQPTGLIALRNAFNGTNLYLAYSDALAPNGTITKGAAWKYNTTTSTWTNLAVPGGQGGFSSISVDAQNPDNIIVGTANRWYPRDEIFRTSDGGRNWKGIITDGIYDYSPGPYSKASTPHWIADVQIDPFNSNVAWFGTGYGLFSTNNLTNADQKNPVNWLFENKGLEETVPLKLISPSSGPPLVSAIGDIDGFRHDSIDVSPKQGRLSPRYGTNDDIDFAEKSPNVMVRTYGNSSGHYGSYSTDGGTNWTMFVSTPPGTTNSGSVAVSADGNTILWNNETNRIYYSTNKGKTWTVAQGISGSPDPVSDRVNPAKFYIYSGGQFYVSTTNGASFKLVSSVLPQSGSIYATRGFEGDIWFTAWNSGLYHSTNSGLNFQKISNIQAANKLGFGKAAPGKNYPAVYLTGNVGGTYGFFRSDDAGTTWVRINDDQHQFGRINDITGDPRFYGRIYLATGGRGIIYGQAKNYDCNGDLNGTASVNGCNMCVGGNSGNETTTCVSTSILNTESAEAFTYSPNPFTESIKVEVKGKFDYMIYDLTGRLLEYGSGIDTCNAGASLPAGIYTLKLIQPTGDSSKQFKILKQ